MTGDIDIADGDVEADRAEYRPITTEDIDSLIRKNQDDSYNKWIAGIVIGALISMIINILVVSMFSLLPIDTGDDMYLLYIGLCVGVLIVIFLIMLKSVKKP